AGQLQTLHVGPGDSVQAGASLADLKSSELAVAITDLATRRDQLRAQLASLRSQQHEDSKAGNAIPEVKKSLTAIEDELAKKQIDVQRLHLVSHRAGIIIPPPEVPYRPSADGRLSPWHGTPLETHNLGATLKAN